jgi:GNAT acetyltransferase-like protein
MSETSRVEVSVRGKWSTIPALQVGPKSIIVKGRWLRVASIHDEQWLDTEVEDPQECVRRLQDCRRGDLAADIFTFAQKLPAVTPKYDYPMELESVAAVRLPGFNDWWESLPQEARKNTRRAAKRGIVVTVRQLDDDLVKDIVELNNDSPMRQGTPFHHYGKTFEQVKKDQSTHTERSEFICAYHGTELVGFLKVVYCGRFGSLLLLITKASHQDKRPANALITKAIERCDEKGLSYMVYGRYRYGNQPRTSLMEFKDRNGFTELFVPRFYVPLTVKGRMALGLNLHRDRVAILPESAIAVGRRVRAEWYRRRYGLRAGVA